MEAETMIEKIARSMAECGGPGDSLSELLINCGATPSQVVRVCAHLASAALEAMRDPGMGVKMAGASAITLEIMQAAANYDAACDCWSAMIDAALTEQPVDPAA